MATGGGVQTCVAGARPCRWSVSGCTTSYPCFSRGLGMWVEPVCDLNLRVLLHLDKRESCVSLCRKPSVNSPQSSRWETNCQIWGAAKKTTSLHRCIPHVHRVARTIPCGFRHLEPREALHTALGPTLGGCKELLSRGWGGRGGRRESIQLRLCACAPVLASCPYASATILS